MPVIIDPRPDQPAPQPEPEPIPQPTPEKPPRVTAETPFRQIPKLSQDRVCEILRGYPMAEECPTLTTSALALAQSYKESQYGKTARGKNPLGLMMPDGHTLMTFDSWRQAFQEWERRMANPSYKNGVYMPEDLSLGKYIRIYVAGPGPGYANGESAESVALYLAQTIARLNRYFGYDEKEPVWPISEPSAPTESGSPAGDNGSRTEITFGRVPRPQNYAEHILAPGINTAWDDLGPRTPRGLILHRMQGTLIGTDAYFAGAARKKACTDFGIGKGSDGRWNRIIRWTQPGASVAPWASGPADGIDGDGAAFWQRYKSDPIGVSIFNRDCESIELEGNYDSPINDVTYQALVELVSWRADAWLRIPYDRWPLNNDGIHCLLGHSEVTNQKICPGPVFYALVPRLIEDVRVRLRSYQQ